jgi:hypothetical protein
MRTHGVWPAFALAALIASHAFGAAQDDLLYREALKADQRMYDNLQAFAKALRAVLGSEPKLSALEVSENTGSALVRNDDGSTRSFEFVEGKLTEPDRSPLRDEGPRDRAIADRFIFGDIDLNKVRAALKAQRARPGHIGDTAPELAVRYRSIVGRWMLTIQVGSMAIGGLDLVSYDFRTGEAVDLKASSTGAMPRSKHTISACARKRRRTRTSGSDWRLSICWRWATRQCMRFRVKWGRCRTCATS